MNGLPTFSQDHDAPTSVTAAMQQKIRQDIEKEATRLRPQLQKNNNQAEVEFYLDTFRVEQYVGKMMKQDYSTVGMKEALYAGAKLYDSLLNKYYRKLSTLLKGDDKKALVQAQKAWIAFRDAESNLVDIMSKDEYSGGGSIQGVTEADMYLAFIRNRVVALFEHYMRTQAP